MEVNITEGSVKAYRTSAFKDWFADGSAGGTSNYINEIYTVTTTDNNGWNFSSPDGHIVKTIHLDSVRPELRPHTPFLIQLSLNFMCATAFQPSSGTYSHVDTPT